jgi:hypothetical protein
MKTFQWLLAGGAGTLFAAAVSCNPPDRDFGAQSSTSSGGGSSPSGGGGAIPGTTNGSVGQVGSGPTTSGPTTSGGGPCGTSADCDDGDLCTDESCVGGACVYASNVDDGNVCTKDSCTPEVGPVHFLDGNCCPHSVCAPGVPLNKACIFLGSQQEVDCAPKVCNLSPECCSKQWDASCVENAKSLCVSLASDKISCACGHSYCNVGSPLDLNCDPCVAAVCSYAPSCCTSAWDSNCITQAHQYCNIPLGASCQ